jgi:hypothetical protein
MGRVRGSLLIVAWFLLTAMPLSGGQEVPGTAGETPALQSHFAESLYLQLRSVGLDRSRVYRVREASFDRAAIHITLDDGTIAFTEDVNGHVTGAFFEGDGDVLLIPPDQVERASMELFTGAAILEERFVSAYFRFNDDTFAELQPSLRPADNASEFVSQWNETARNLAEGDPLRLLVSFSRFLPVSGPAPLPDVTRGAAAHEDHLLHARLQGRKLGAFDLYYDSNAVEQIRAGQLRTVEGSSYYDAWTSFSLNPPGKRDESLDSVAGDDGRAGEINISRYKIRTEIKPPTKLDAEALVHIEVRQGGQRTVLFELSRFLHLQRVEADGHAVEFIHNQALEGTQLARRGNDLVAVVFPEPLRTGQEMELRFVYGGEVLSEAGGGLLYVGARGTWYPNRGLAMSRYELEFHYPAGWTLVATGKRVDVPASGSTENSVASANTPPEQVTGWVSERPMPVAGFNLGKYARVEAHAGEVMVETYAASGVERSFPKASGGTVASGPLIPPGLRLEPPPMVVTPPPPSPARNAQPVADMSARAIEFFARRFGPYPYSSLALTQMPGEMSQGWPGLIFLSSISFLTTAEKSQLRMNAVDRTLSDGVIAHETAHQWWGDLVVWSGYRDQWIVEALANYSSMMMLESEDPVQFRKIMEKYRDELLEKNKDDRPLMDAGPVTLGLRLSSSRFPAGYEAISYGRGTWLFHMLRYMMRDAEQKAGKRPSGAQGAQTDEPFLRALRTLRERYQEKSVTTRDVLRVFEEQLPPSLWYEGRKSLDWFYQGWVNGTAVPRFELQGVKYSDKTGSTAISGTILQKAAPKGLVSSVPVYAVVAGKTLLLGRVFADGSETQFYLTGPPGTRKVVLDPHQTLLAQER